MPKKINSRFTDIQGSVRLVTDATLGITELVEKMHHRIVHPPLMPSTPIQHIITGFASIAYFNVKMVTRLVGGGIDKSMGLIPKNTNKKERSEKREKMVSALNGVVGDHLEKSKNPLAIPMQFRFQGKALSFDKNVINGIYPKINGKILVLVHGLCMNDLLWTQAEHDHGIEISQKLNFTPVYLHYNSGLNISTNGQALNELLDELIQHWPVPVEEVCFVAHSMGGLITRSATYYGQEQTKSWTSLTKKMIFLGSPFHGAPLEKAGSYLDFLLESIPYVKPFARLGKIRSAGITDLRHGNLVDDHWEGRERFNVDSDDRTPIPLPETISCYAIAASKSQQTESPSRKLKGDGLVTVASALGKHKDPGKCLKFEEANTSIIHECKHHALLSDKRVYNQIIGYLSN